MCSSAVCSRAVRHLHIEQDTPQLDCSSGAITTRDYMMKLAVRVTDNSETALLSVSAQLGITAFMVIPISCSSSSTYCKPSEAS
jgi:hypothetical protein